MKNSKIALAITMVGLSGAASTKFYDYRVESINHRFEQKENQQ